MLVGRELEATSLCGQVDYDKPVEELMARCGIKIFRGRPPSEWPILDSGTHEVEIETVALQRFSNFQTIIRLLAWNREFADPIAVLDIFACQNPDFLETHVALTFFKMHEVWYYLMLARLGTGELECTVQPVEFSAEFSHRCAVAAVRMRGSVIRNLVRSLLRRLHS